MLQLPLKTGFCLGRTKWLTRNNGKGSDLLVEVLDRLQQIEETLLNNKNEEDDSKRKGEKYRFAAPGIMAFKDYP